MDVSLEGQRHRVTDGEGGEARFGPLKNPQAVQRRLNVVGEAERDATLEVLGV